MLLVPCKWIFHKCLGVVHGNVVNIHGPVWHSRCNRSGVSKVVVGESTADSQVEQDEVALVGSSVPGICSDGALGDGVEEDAVHIPLQALNCGSAIDFNGIFMPLQSIVLV